MILLTSTQCFAHEHAIVEHHDRIQVNKTLFLPQLIDLTLEKFPEQLLNQAREQEADALQQRGNSWLALPITHKSSHTILFNFQQQETSTQKL